MSRLAIECFRSSQASSIARASAVPAASRGAVASAKSENGNHDAVFAGYDRYVSSSAAAVSSPALHRIDSGVVAAPGYADVSEGQSWRYRNWERGSE